LRAAGVLVHVTSIKWRLAFGPIHPQQQVRITRVFTQGVEHRMDCQIPEHWIALVDGLLHLRQCLVHAAFTQFGENLVMRESLADQVGVILTRGAI